MKIKEYTNNYIRTHSIKTTYITYVVFFTVIMSVFLLSVVWAVWSFAFRDNYTQSYVNSANATYENRLYMILNHLNNFSLNLSTNQELYLTILNKNLSDGEKDILVKSELKATLYNTSTIAGVEIQTDEKNYFYFKDDVNINYPTIDASTKTDKRRLYVDSDYIVHNDKKFFRICKKLSNFYSGYEVGNIIFYVEEDFLSTIYNNSLSAEKYTLITADDIVISHFDKSQIGKKITSKDGILKSFGINVENEKNFLIHTYSVDKWFLQNDIKMICVLSRERVVQHIFNLMSKIYILILVFMILSIIFAIRLSQSLTHELRDLMKRMGDFKDNMFKSIKLKKKKTKVNEIKQLEDSFEKMLDELNLLIVANEENSEKRRKAELSALQAQINPHFLYNVLDVISWLAKMEHQDLIEKMVSALSNFYRMGLHNGDNEIPVHDEIEHVKNYVFLQKVRFPDSFHVEIDVDERLMNVKIVKIVLQPLVENSIKHGFRKMSKGGYIKVSGRLLDDKYYEFSVSDNGCGLETDPISSSENTGNGYGVKNVNERLIMAYGKECGLNYSDTPGGGTTVTFRIKAGKEDVEKGGRADD